MQPLAGIPLACSIVAFVLGMLCLFAGDKPGFMEDYHIVSLNTSDLGASLIPTATSGGSSPSSTASGVGGEISALSSLLPREPGIGDDIENALGDLEGDITDAIAKELGIKEWYSLHLMDMCEGDYKPNATAKHAGLNVTSCTNRTAMYHFNIDTILSNELSIGPLHLNLSDINWPDAIQNGLNTLDTALDATFVFYCIGIAAAGVAMFTSLAAIFMGHRLFSFLNWGLAGISFAAFLIGSIIITVLQDKATGIINKYGKDIGVVANKGKKFLIITWVAAALMFLACLVWVVMFCIGNRNSKREYTEKKSGRKTRHSGSSEFARRQSGV